MIDYIRYTLDGVTYDLIHNEDGTWSREETAPDVAGNYSLLFEISENGVVTFIDSSSYNYDFYLDIVEATEKVANLQDYVPKFISSIREFELIFNIENTSLDLIHAEMEKIKSDMFISSSSPEAIFELETFLHIVGQGTLDQRKSYLHALLQKGNKLSETTIKNIALAVSGSDCITKFFTEGQLDNPEPTYGLLRVQILSPNNSKDYRYADIERTLVPLVPSHIKLVVIKFFALWQDINNNFASWASVSNASDWQSIKSYIPPQ